MARRKRRPQTSRPQRAATAAASDQPAGTSRPRRPRPDWRWRTFPVFSAFVAGMLLAFFVNVPTQNPVAFVLLIGALLGFGYSLAHLVVTNLVTAGRSRRGDTTETAYEDELVYPDE
jgi:hypothetical protein